MTTSPPFSLSCRAISSPIPELPPVTSARTSESFMGGFYVSLNHPGLGGAIEDPARSGLVHLDEVKGVHAREHLRFDGQHRAVSAQLAAGDLSRLLRKPEA